MMIEDFKRKFTLLLIGLLTLASIVGLRSCNGRTSLLCIESERQALLRFKQDIKDPSDRLSSWSVAKECCQWIGVICDNTTNHVKELHLGNPHPFDSDLETQAEVETFLDFDSEIQAEVEAFSSFKLRGKINPSLLDLNQLNYLDLSYNDFGGIQISSFIGSLKKLRYLNLSKAGFEGLVPHQLGNLSNLRNLGIQGPDIYLGEAGLYVKNLHWLYGLSSLVHLDMTHVNLSVASDWLTVINSLPSLLELHLSECTLQVFPSLSLVNFTSLSILDLSGNTFHSPIPDWIFSLNSLVSLNLGDNGFEGPIPIGLQNLTQIRNLDLSENDFNSIIPDWLYNLESLQNLDLHSNNLQGLISAAIKNFTSVSTLDFSYNELETKIPKEMGNLCNLKLIRVEGNKLGGSVSEVFESLSVCLSSSLESLFMGGNNFSGHLPDKVGKFKHLRDLQLGGNLISGPIPSKLGSLSSLVYLNLSGNQLTGMIPECIGNLSKLERLQIHHNLLEGVLTEVHLENLTSLRELYASNNHRLTLEVSPAWVPPFRLSALKLRNWNLGPKFPLWIQSQDHLRVLDLSGTGIADSIPTWLWNITSRTRYLNLSHNQIGGELPADLSFSAQFTVIYLSSNKIKGALPYIAGNVGELDLSNNSFSGTISRFLCNPKDEPNRLRILHLGENRLSGEIPDCWMKWRSLRVIKLGNNNLTGKVPISIGYLPELRSLHLRNNSLSGGVPESLKNCSELLTLDFGMNKFVGSIPVWMTGSNFPKLKVLGLRSNMLKGEIPPELCSLDSLQILDVADNNLSGEIPKCVGNFKAMTTKQSSADPIFYSLNGGFFMENAFVVIKGREIQYNTILTLATSIDMSNNDISGGIPEGVTALLGLQSLNLSRNRLTGPIPNKIGDMQWLESADLSRNHLAGRIPPSMSSMHFLNYLNLSNNNLSGEIPLSTQLQSLNASSFLGNALCGPPLTENCSTERAPPFIRNKYEKGSDGVILDEFYLSMVIGFVVILFGVWGPLIYISSWRRAYFRFLDHVLQRVSGKFCK